MPLRYHEPFKNPLSNLTPSVNKFTGWLSTENCRVVYGEKLQNIKGRWRQEFGFTESSPFILEIGCYKGRTLLDMAADHSESLFLGMDITFKRVVTCDQRIQKRKIKNCAVTLASALYLDQIFFPEEVSAIVMFYPDPWPKLRQRKKRLINLDFVKKSWDVLQNNGFFWLKTDDKDYFLNSEKLFLEQGFTKVSFQDASHPFKRDYSSSFQELLGAQGAQNHEALFQKTRNF